ncbi:MAG: hypothetical protein ACI8O8_000435 [Oleiphilaceae bacterium]|jgi:uncharacterized protein YjaG (DUF416 family)
MNKQKFLKSLQSLGGWRERAFMLALAERAAPNAALYFENMDTTDLENKIDLNRLFDDLWQHLIIDPKEDEIIECLDKIVELRMLTDDSESYGALPAADCLENIEQASLCLVNEDKKRASDASQLSIATVTQFIEFSEGEGLEENALIKLFDKHPLVEREFSFQAEVNDLLRAAMHPGIDVINELRDLARDEGLSNIGISLTDTD